MRILIVGPSPERSKGGMSTVIEEIRNDEELNQKFDIDICESYIDGNKLTVLLYSIYAFAKFWFAKRNYDIYHIHAASYGSTFRKGWYVRAARKWGKKVILHIHGAEYMLFYEKSKKKKQISDILKSANMVVALSEDWKRKFDNTFDLKNCVVLENGIDMDRLAPAVIPPSEYQHCFVTLGRLGERKGTYDLVDAIEIAKKTVPDIKCYFAGDGEVEKFRSIIKERRLENNAVIVGWADFDKKLELLKKISTVVLPSYNEGLPMSVLEGMACGKAIISTTVGAIPEVVSDENGILITPGDVNALSDALIKCCIDLSFMENVSAQNIEKIRRSFSIKTMHEKLCRYYKEV